MIVLVSRAIQYRRIWAIQIRPNNESAADDSGAPLLLLLNKPLNLLSFIAAILGSQLAQRFPNIVIKSNE
jgi:hypothetical protein